MTLVRTIPALIIQFCRCRNGTEGSKKRYLVTDDESHFALVQDLVQPERLVGDDQDGRWHSEALLGDELRWKSQRRHKQRNRGELTQLILDKLLQMFTFKYKIT